MTRRIRKNKVKIVRCHQCNSRIHRGNIYPEVTRQYVEIHATCPYCGMNFIIDRKHREAINR